MADDFGAQLARVQGDLRALDRRVIKVEKYCEEDSPEFHREMQSFVSSYRAVEAEREKVAASRHQENSERLQDIKTRSDLWNLAIALLGLVCAICMLYLAVKTSGRASLDPFQSSHRPAISQHQQQPVDGRDSN